MMDDEIQLPYGVRYGKMAPKGPPLAFMRCRCGVMLLTKPSNHGTVGERGGCEYERTHPVQGPQLPRHTRIERATRVGVALVAALVMGWAALTIATGPGRDEIRQAIEAS